MQAPKIVPFFDLVGEPPSWASCFRANAKSSWLFGLLRRRRRRLGPPVRSATARPSIFVSDILGSHGAVVLRQKFLGLVIEVGRRRSVRSTQADSSSRPLATSVTVPARLGHRVKKQQATTGGPWRNTPQPPPWEAAEARIATLASAATSLWLGYEIA